MIPRLWAVSDLHAAIPANREKINGLAARSPGDWLIVAGDVGERIDVVRETLARLREKFAEVIWVPGNHELFSTAHSRFAGREKYDELVRVLRGLGVRTPEDPFAVFHGVTVAALFTLYDYSHRDPSLSEREALRLARSQGVALLDDVALTPFVDVRAWCRERLRYSVARLAATNSPTVLVNHWPLARAPIERLAYPEIALWSGTRHTEEWPRRFRAAAVVYGHLHMPGTAYIEGIPHHEVSLGYPREWRRPNHIAQAWPYPVLEGRG